MARSKVLLILLPYGLLAWLLLEQGANRTPVDLHQPLPNLGASAPYRLDEKPSLTVATFNIHHGEGPDGYEDLSRTAALLEDCEIVALQEVRGFTFSSQAEQLAGLLNCQGLYFGTEHQWWRDHLGNGLLVQDAPQFVQRLPLLGTRGKAFRIADLAIWPLASGSLKILSVHVDSQDDRTAQLAALIAVFWTLEPPVLLMGDLNTPASDPQLGEFLKHPELVASYPAKETPTPPIDWIIGRGVKLADIQHTWNDASDHPVVRARVLLPHAGLEEPGM